MSDQIAFSKHISANAVNYTLYSKGLALFLSVMFVVLLF